MEWRFAHTDRKAADRLARELGVSPVLAGLLARRGLGDPEKALSFLNPALGDLPSPFLLPDLGPAVERLAQALFRREAITVYGDYDADGLTSAALVADVLESLGARVKTYIPHRLEEGYGLNTRAVETLAAEGAGLIVTVDCGVSDHEAVARAGDLGLDVIVTDHHQLPDRLPPALAVVNPLRPESRFPQRRLAGVGVAFFLAGGLRQFLRERGLLTRAGQPELAPLLGLVAIGTVADVAPLTGVNRILTRIGLEHLGRPDRPGLAALKEVSALEAGRPLTAREVAFRLAPRLNAAGRLGSAQPGLELLRVRDQAAAQAAAVELERLNRERRRLQAEVLRQAEDLIAARERDLGRTIVLAAEGWPRGLVGLAASKLAEKYLRPTILLALEDGLARGSGRSIKGFNMFAALTRCRDLMIRFGGHEQAAGLTLDRDKVDDLVRAFEETAAGHLDPAAGQPVLEVEALVTLSDLEGGLAEELAGLAPFGEGNPEPVLALSGLEVLAAGCVGAPPGHLRLTLAQDGKVFETMGFGLGGLLPGLGRKVSVAVQRYNSTFQGRSRPGWKVVDVRKGALPPDWPGTGQIC
ncbi:MAG: single-stranded-DNA-specific exonuclease RecJ [Thermodesulfobacteriota bacterium]